MNKRFAAAITSLPLLCGVAVMSAGSAVAADCPTGTHWNDFGGSDGYCAPDASGGGNDGDSSTDLGGTPPATAAPVVPAPPAPQETVAPPVRYEPPAIVPASPTAPAQTVAPAPAPAPAKAGTSGNNAYVGQQVPQQNGYVPAAGNAAQEAMVVAPDEVVEEKKQEEPAPAPSPSETASAAPPPAATHTASAKATPSPSATAAPVEDKTDTITIQHASGGENDPSHIVFGGILSAFGIGAIVYSSRNLLAAKGGRKA